MASEFNRIQRGELQQRLSHGLDINERAPAATLASDVQAVVLLEDLTKQTPFQQVMDRRAGGLAVAPNVAGEFGTVHLVNPSGSGVVIVPLCAWVVCSNTTDVRWGIGTSVLPGTSLAGGETFLDLRNGTGPPTGILQIGTDPGFPVFSEVGIQRVPVSIPNARIDLSNFVLSPGELITFAAQTVALELKVGFEWQEYGAR